MQTNTTRELKTAIRQGPYAWPGGYPMYMVCQDGAALCWDCVKENLKEILQAVRDQDRSGWNIDCSDINWEDTDMRCDHCNQQIESAYGEINEH